MLNVTHISSAHSRNDIRVFKMCKTLITKKFNVSYIVADGKNDDLEGQVNIYDVGASKDRLQRIIFTPSKLFIKAVKLSSDIYHLHDPELLFIGLKLKKAGKTVIFDSHEDVASQMLHKPYLNKVLLRIIAYIYKKIEKFALSRFDGVIGATPHISKKLSLINSNTIPIQNFPVFQKKSQNKNRHVSKPYNICYIGGISKIRGITQLVRSLELTKNKVNLNLIGNFDYEATKNKVSLEKGWSNVINHGFINQDQAFKILKNSIAGVVTFLPSENHIFAQPNKLFEYMSAGVPVIASNFDLWRKIIEVNECGLCVDPLDIKKIAEAIDYLIDNPQDLIKMGKNGEKAYLEKYNWSTELEKLSKFYNTLTK